MPFSQPQEKLCPRHPLVLRMVLACSISFAGFKAGIPTPRVSTAVATKSPSMRMEFQAPQWCKQLSKKAPDSGFLPSNLFLRPHPIETSTGCQGSFVHWADRLSSKGSETTQSLAEGHAARGEQKDQHSNCMCQESFSDVHAEDCRLADAAGPLHVGCLP